MFHLLCTVCSVLNVTPSTKTAGKTSIERMLAVRRLGVSQLAQ
jgi:hypothetical protein